MSENKVRGAAIVKLVVWLVVLAILCPIFIFAMESDFLDDIVHGYNFSLIGGDYYKDADSYNVGEFEYGEQITGIDIDWVSGKIELVVYDGDTVKLEEENEGTDRDDWMRSKVENGRLVIKHVKSGMFFFHSSPTKDLKVYLPEEVAENLGAVSIDSVSSDIRIEAIAAGKIDISTVSGSLKLNNVNVGTLDIDGTSNESILNNVTVGEIDIDTTSGSTLISSGAVGKINFDSVSGDLEVYTSSMPTSVEGDTTSGSFKLYTPFSEEGFRAEIDSVSGDMNVWFADGKKMSGNSLVVGSGKYSYEFDSTSGNFTITETEMN